MFRTESSSGEIESKDKENKGGSGKEETGLAKTTPKPKAKSGGGDPNPKALPKAGSKVVKKTVLPKDMDSQTLWREGQEDEAAHSGRLLRLPGDSTEREERPELELGGRRAVASGGESTAAVQGEDVGLAETFRPFAGRGP